ncbi:MAG TPA: GAF domain-containing protein, partial [Ktedonobacteraceae bacterium]
MQDSLTWRELLGNIIKDPQEKQTIASELGISPLTLTRWVSGESTPRFQNLRHLLMVVPEHRKTFLSLVNEEFGYSFNEPLIADPTSDEIPSSFYARVLSTRVNSPDTLRLNTLADMILQQALSQLDPHLIGLEVTVVRCMSPAHNGKVRSLRECIGYGTSPWNKELGLRTFFLGAESLAGYVVATGRPMAIQSRCDGDLFPVYWVENENSSMAYPIMRADHVAGCLLLSCTQPDYFLSSVLRTLVQNYAELLAVAFEPDNFYDLQSIELGRMPPFEMQRAQIATFRGRMLRITSKMHINVQTAERLAWQEIENDLLHLSQEE